MPLPFPSPFMSAEALAKADVGEGGAKRRMRGCFREFNRERVAREGNPSSVSPLSP